jgi:AraC-like DNA-binding protein
MDALSEILALVQMSGAVYFHGEFTAPWCVGAPDSKELAPLLAPGAPQLLIYHLVLEGRLFARTAGTEPVAVGPGEVVVFPHGEAHFLSSETGPLEPMSLDTVVDKVQRRDLRPLHAGGGGACTRLVCGFIACDAHAGRSLLQGLPPVFRVGVRGDAAGEWLERTILRLVDEAASGDSGSHALLTKLSEALFVDTLRRYVATLPAGQRGWLAGTRDTIVGRSLRLLHRDAHRSWTLSDLARQVGVSRSALAERFTRYLGEPPMSYLAHWRLGTAAQSLMKTQKTVAEIAAESGYESEASFSRAFKRMTGRPPARYRRDSGPWAAPT